MKTFFYFFSSLSLICSTTRMELHAQTFQFTLQSDVYTSGTAVLPTPDGGLLVGAVTADAPFSGTEALITKINPQGSIDWSFLLEGSTSDGVSDIIATPDGNYLGVGTTYSFNSAPYGNVLLFKFSPSGQVLWSKMYGGPGYDYGNRVKPTSDGGFILAGLSSSFSAGGNDLYALKTDSLGDAVWAIAIGGSSNDEAQQIIPTADGGYMLVGSTSSFAPGMVPTYGFALCKLTANGSLAWMKKLDLGGYSLCYDAVPDTDGGFLLAGWTDGSGQGMNDIVLVKTDSLGNGLWAKTYGGDSMDIAYSMLRMPNGNLSIGGFTRSFGGGKSDGYVLQLDPQGNLLWSAVYGGSGQDYFYDMVPWAGNGFAAIGSTESFGTSGRDLFLVAADAAGNSGCHQDDPPTLSGVVVPTTDSVSPIVLSVWLTIPINHILDSGANLAVLCQNLQSISQNEAQSPSLYPNPCNEEVQVSFSEILEEVSLTDVFGRLLLKQTPGETELRLNTRFLPSGTYFLWTRAKGETHHQKLIVARP